MFTIALSFLIFAGSAFGLLSRLLASQAETALGADLYAFALPPPAMAIIDEGRITQFLKSQNESFADIQGWTYASHSLSWLLAAIAPPDSHGHA